MKDVTFDALVITGIALATVALGFYESWRLRQTIGEVGDYPLPPNDEGQEEEF